MVILDDNLKKTYTDRYNSMTINQSNLLTTNSICDKILKNKSKYDIVGVAPWYVVGVIHNMESSLDFTKFLCNGQSLKSKTTIEPIGFPENSLGLKKDPSTGMYDWSETSKITLQRRKLPSVWDIPNTLFFIESYNGTGYLQYHPTCPSPYLWSGSSVYTKGKYGIDGKFDPNLVSKQIGAAVLLKYINNKYNNLIG